MGSLTLQSKSVWYLQHRRQKLDIITVSRYTIRSQHYVPTSHRTLNTASNVLRTFIMTPYFTTSYFTETK